MELQEIKDSLQVANETITAAAETANKIDADVVLLHEKIDALTENSDAETIAEIKELANTLKSNAGALKYALDATDGKTTDKTVPEGEEDTPIEDTPIEDTPIEDTPIEDTPIEDTPIEETVSESDEQL